MQLKRVQITGDPGPSLAIISRGAWLPLKAVLAQDGHTLTPEEDRLAADMVPLLQSGHAFRQELSGLLDAYHRAHDSDAVPFDDTPMLPFEPRSYRDFMLYERHAVDAARGYTRRFMPSAYRIASTYERITGRIFPAFRPKRIWYEKPIYYMGNHLNFVTDRHGVAFPPYSTALDYELELGALIVHPLENATAEEALAAVGGFVVFNDFSARDVQLAEMRSGFGPAKSKHFINAVSSVLVSADEVVSHLDSLRARVRINGRTVVETTTAGMHFTLGEAIAHASQGERIHPGEFVATGTLPGGSGMENGRWLSRGDTIELEIERVGTLTNIIA